MVHFAAGEKIWIWPRGTFPERVAVQPRISLTRRRLLLTIKLRARLK